MRKLTGLYKLETQRQYKIPFKFLGNAKNSFALTKQNNKTTKIANKALDNFKIYCDMYNTT